MEIVLSCAAAASVVAIADRRRVRHPSSRSPTSIADDVEIAAATASLARNPILGAEPDFGTEPDWPTTWKIASVFDFSPLQIGLKSEKSHIENFEKEHFYVGPHYTDVNCA